MGPEELKKVQKGGSGMADDASKEHDGSSQGMGQAEVTRDEFGGYCCKRWGAGGEANN